MGDYKVLTFLYGLYPDGYNVPDYLTFAADVDDAVIRFGSLHHVGTQIKVITWEDLETWGFPSLPARSVRDAVFDVLPLRVGQKLVVLIG